LLVFVLWGREMRGLKWWRRSAARGEIDARTRAKVVCGVGRERGGAGAEMVGG
jgi:hypothetical protein